MDAETRQALSDLKYYIDAQPIGKEPLIFGKNVRELEGYKNAAALLSVANIDAGLAHLNFPRPS